MSDDDTPDSTVSTASADEARSLLSSARSVPSLPSFPAFTAAPASSLNQPPTRFTTPLRPVRATARVDPTATAESRGTAFRNLLPSFSYNSESKSGGVQTPSAATGPAAAATAAISSDLPLIYPIVLRSKDCPKRDYAFKSLARAFTKLTPNVTPTGTAVAGEGVRGNPQPLSSLRHQTSEIGTELYLERKNLRDPLKAVLRWYHALCSARQHQHNRWWADQHSGAGGAAPVLAAPKLVVVLEDLDSFNGSVLSDLLYQFTEGELSSISIVVVMGVATSSEALHGLLSADAARRCWIRKFQLKP